MEICLYYLTQLFNCSSSSLIQMRTYHFFSSICCLKVEKCTSFKMYKIRLYTDLTPHHCLLCSLDFNVVIPQHTQRNIHYKMKSPKMENKGLYHCKDFRKVMPFYGKEMLGLMPSILFQCDHLKTTWEQYIIQISLKIEPYTFTGLIGNQYKSTFYRTNMSAWL